MEFYCFHDTAHRSSPSMCAGVFLVDSPTDSIFLPFSLIRLIIYKCCFKIVVFVSLHCHWNIYMYVCERCWIACFGICACHRDYGSVGRFKQKLSVRTLKLYRMVHLKWIWVHRNGRPMVVRQPILNLVKMSAWTKIMAFRFGNNSARFFSTFIVECGSCKCDVNCYRS